MIVHSLKLFLINNFVETNIFQFSNQKVFSVFQINLFSRSNTIYTFFQIQYHIYKPYRITKLTKIVDRIIEEIDICFVAAVDRSCFVAAVDRSCFSRSTYVQIYVLLQQLIDHVAMVVDGGVGERNMLDLVLLLWWLLGEKKHMDLLLFRSLKKKLWISC